jgi:hypothetical protein
MTPSSHSPGNAARQTLVYFLDRYGLPTVLILVFGWWVGTRVAEPLVQSHTQFLSEQVKYSSQQSECMSKMQDFLHKHSDMMRTLNEKQCLILDELLTLHKAKPPADPPGPGSGGE